MRYKIEKAIREQYRPLLPPGLETLRNVALFDLTLGPSGTGPEYPGYTAALKQLRQWAEAELPSVLYYDPDSGELLSKEPCAWTNGDQDENGDPIWFEPSPYFEVSRRTIWRAVFGELADNGL